MDVRRQRRTDDITDLALRTGMMPTALLQHTIDLAGPAVPPWIIGRMVVPRRA
jgi:hypothetical protein